MMSNAIKVPFEEFNNGSSINGLSRIQDSPLDLFIGNFVEDNTNWSYSVGFHGTIYGIAIIKQALTEEQIQEVVKSMGLQ